MKLMTPFFVAVGAAGLLLACGDAAPPEKPKDTSPRTGIQPPGAPGAGDGGLVMSTLPRMEFAENDFAESDRNRDPFRTYISIISPKDVKAATTQRIVILPDYSLDELRLVAIVMGGDYPRAMVVDPGTKGWVIKHGDWVGRPETVHVGGANGADYQLNWRVDKVRDGDVVFTREDPAQPGVPPASRVIQLRPDTDNTREKL